MSEDTTATTVASVDEFDLERYLGLWHEIGRLPLKWEDTDATEVTATYSLNDDGSIKVDNRCFDKDGAPTQSEGQATVVEGEIGQLEVSFLPSLLRWIPFTKGDYWVLKIDPDYHHVLVGTPDHSNLWFLARTPQVSPEIEAEFLAEAQRQGFELRQWIRPTQTGRIVTDDLLE